MIFRPDKRILAAALAPLMVVLATGGPLAAAPGDDAIARALAALEREDGIAAELAGKQAMEEGASRAQVAALIGVGEFLQGDLDDAREWLGDAEFDDTTQARGLHALARLELAEEDFPAAALIFDQMLQEGHANGRVWVDIGRMRYRAGQHHLALEAAREAVRIDPDEPRALEFLAELVRDSQGLHEALPVLRNALEQHPDDAGLLGQYAAVLGDAGEHRHSLRVIRQLLDTDGGALNGYYLQAIIAARAGENDLARRLWWRTDGSFDSAPAGLAMSGILEFRAGNYALAVEHFDQLRRNQPFSQTALLMFGRALVANGEANVAVDLLEPHAQRPDASNYLLVLTARAHEQLGQRAQAAQYLDRSARLVSLSASPVPGFLARDTYGNLRDPSNPVMQIRNMLSEGRHSAARARIAELTALFAGSVDLQLLAGDVEFLAGDLDAALVQYGEAAAIRSNWPLVRRMVLAHTLKGEEETARRLLAVHLLQNPRDQAAAALLGRMHRAAGNPARATVLLRHAASFGSGTGDPILMAELAELELVLGNADDAMDRAQRAHGLQRSNRRVARAFARVIEMSGENAQLAQILFDKAG